MYCKNTNNINRVHITLFKLIEESTAKSLFHGSRYNYLLGILGLFIRTVAEINNINSRFLMNFQVTYSCTKFQIAG